MILNRITQADGKPGKGAMPPLMPLDEYRALLARKMDHLTEYKEMSEAIKDALMHNGGKILMDRIRKRQKLIHCINRLDDDIRDLRIRYQPTHGCDPKADRDIAEMIKDMEQTLDRISALDAACIDLAASEKRMLKNNILGYHQKRIGTKEYRTGSIGPARFVDTRIR